MPGTSTQRNEISHYPGLLATSLGGRSGLYLCYPRTVSSATRTAAKFMVICLQQSKQTKTSLIFKVSYKLFSVSKPVCKNGHIQVEFLGKCTLRWSLVGRVSIQDAFSGDV